MDYLNFGQKLIQHATSTVVQASSNGDLETLKGKIAEGKDPSMKENLPIQAAAWDGHLEVVKYLLSLGADPTCHNNFPLRGAANNGHTEVVQCLLESGADVHAEDDEALIAAVSSGHVETVQALLEAGANIHARNDQAIIEAGDNGLPDMFKLLLEAGADPNAQHGEPLKRAVHAENLQVAQYLLEVGADVHIDDDLPLRKAAKIGSVELVQLLIEAGATIDAHDGDAIRTAALNNHIDVVNLLATQRAADNVPEPDVEGDEGDNKQGCDQQADADGGHQQGDDDLDQYGNKITDSWSCNKGVNTHSFFLSHRVATDRFTAKELAWLLSEEGNVHCYVDEYCLTPGKKWEEGFMEGLYHSQVVLLLCSEAGLERVKGADKVKDNMLLEWEHALDLQDAGTHTVVPLFIGTTDANTNAHYDFKAYDTSAYPDEMHCHQDSPKKRTIKQTIQSVFDLQGKPVPNPIK
ncbi:hypothetical protein HDV00_006663 [Rhizophlyctis rosea]|nr:hypothetical protein HDV00_006663 [Rhizophlyctis rosea]